LAGAHLFIGKDPVEPGHGQKISLTIALADAKEIS